MLNWLRKCLGIFHQDTSDQTEYELVYGLPRRAVDQWLIWNPRLAAEHKMLDKLARDRRNKAAGKRNHTPA